MHLKIKKDELNAIISISIIILLFILISYLVNSNIEFIKKNIGFSYPGMLFYIVIFMLSVVIAPISAIPLVPLASGQYGWILGGVLSVIGWTLGAVISFQISRKYGVNLVRKFIPIKKIHNFEKLIPKEQMFLGVVILTMILPVDGLSYFIGLFSKMPLKSFTLATLIGIIPFSFTLSYIGTLSLIYQIIIMIFSLVILLIGFLIVHYKKLKKG